MNWRAFGLAGGAALAMLAGAPLASQQSGDAALEAACRAGEVTVPDSCPCTLSGARRAGISDGDLASLFADDGHSQAVDQATYGRFWQVKAQCIAEATMAAMGVDPANPLPGIPPEMRPGQPLGGAPATRPPIARPVAPTPLPDNRQVGQRRGEPSSVPPTGRLSQSAGVTRTIVPGLDGRPDIVETKRQTPFFDYYFSYSRLIEDEPELLALAQQAGDAMFSEVAPNYTSPNPSYREEYHYGWYGQPFADRLLAITISDRPGSRGAPGFSGALLWDMALDREIAWTEVFEAGLWSGRIRRDYCAALQAERRLRGNTYSTGCPEFDALGISLERSAERSGENGDELVFVALNGTAGSYAEGPYEVRLALNDALLAGVREPYRGLFSAAPASSAVALRDRLGEIEQVLAGDIQASDDYFFLTGGAENFTRVEQFDALYQSGSLVTFMTLYEPPQGEWGYSIILDGQRRNLSQVSHNEDWSQRTYSDGTVSLTIERGAQFRDNPAFGYGIDTITLSVGGESETFFAINFGGA